MTDFLFARPSFLSGVARVLDVGATFDAYNTSPNGVIADARATLADWKAVGRDLREAAESVREQVESQQAARP